MKTHPATTAATAGEARRMEKCLAGRRTPLHYPRPDGALLRPNGINRLFVELFLRSTLTPPS